MTPTEQDNELQFCESCSCMTRGNPTCGKCGAWRETETMTPTKQDKELRIAIHKRMIAFRREDGNGYIDRCIEHLDSVMQLITADRKRVALAARLQEVEVSIIELERSDDPRFYSKDEAIRSQRARYTHLKAQQEEV